MRVSYGQTPKEKAVGTRISRQGSQKQRTILGITAVAALGVRPDSLQVFVLDPVDFHDPLPNRHRGISDLGKIQDGEQRLGK